MQNSLSFLSQAQAQGFDEYRHDYIAYARVPTETNCPVCGWDSVAQSAVNPACTTCNGVGKIISWVKYTLSCRLMWTNMVKFAYPFPTTGTELGDCVITVPYEFVGIMDAVMNNERAYIVANDKTVRPKTKQEQLIPGIVREYEYVCNLFSPETT